MTSRDPAVDRYYNRLDGITDRFHRVMWRRIASAKSDKERRALGRGKYSTNAYRSPESHFSLPCWWRQEIESELGGAP